MKYNDFEPIIVNVYYAVFVSVAIFSNGLLIYLIRYRSPHIVRSFKVILLNISTVQILTAVTAAFLQGRMMLSSSTVAILSDGPSRIFGPMTCIVSFTVFNALSSYGELLIVHTMFCRYRMLQSNQMKTAELLLSFGMVAIWPVLSLVSPHITSSRYDIVMEEIIREHPNYNLEKYGYFGGFILSDPIQTTILLMSFAIVTASPIIICYLRRLILKTLDRNQQYTARTVQSSKMFLKALTLQAIAPVLCFVPTSLMAFSARTFQSEVVFIEYLMLVIAALPCVIDPLIAIYFVPSYRTWVMKKLCKRSFPTKVEAISKIKGPVKLASNVGAITIPMPVNENMGLQNKEF